MQIRRTLISLLVAAAFVGSGIAIATSKPMPTGPSSNLPGIGQKAMDHSMKGGGMRHGDMAERMSECEEIMRAAAMSPGNAQLQIRAEMMREIGRSIARFGEEVGADEGSAP